MASVDKIPSGRWRARWRETPNAPQRSKTFDRKTDALNFLKTVEADLLRGDYVDPAVGRELVREFVERWKTSQPWRPSTRDRVESLLKSRVLPRFGDMPLQNVRPSDVQGWVGQMSAEGLAPATVEGCVRLLTSIMVAAVSDRLIARSPVAGIRLPRAEKGHHSLVPLTIEQVRVLADRVPARYRALVLAAAGLGLRQGEACGLTVDRVDFLRRTVRIDRQLTTVAGRASFGPPKTPASVRTLPLADEVAGVLAAHLQQWPANTEGVIFTRPSGIAINRQRLSEMIRTARAPGFDDVTFHDLRHFTASGLIASGCSVKAVQAFLGHATASETLDTYGHLWPSDDEAIRSAIGRVLNPPESRLSHAVD